MVQNIFVRQVVALGQSIEIYFKVLLIYYQSNIFSLLKNGEIWNKRALAI